MLRCAVAVSGMVLIALLQGCASTPQPASPPPGNVRLPPPGTLETPLPSPQGGAVISVGSEIAIRAISLLGAPYRYGGSGPVAFDCSGLVRYAMSVLDMVMPRTAATQAKAGTEVPKDLAALKPGDVLTFGRGKRISHVGIYVGDGKMVHASTSQRRVIETSITARNPLIRQWKGVRRFVDGASARFRDSVLAFADTLQ